VNLFSILFCRSGFVSSSHLANGISKISIIRLDTRKLEEVAKPKGKGPNFLIEELQISQVEVGLPPIEPAHTDQECSFCRILFVKA